MKTSAIFDRTRTYRYELRRTWDEDVVPCVFIGLNPSIADEKQDDPTIRRAIGFSKRWGFGGIVMLNIFALQSTDPKALYAANDPIGPENDLFIAAGVTKAATVFLAWGNHGAYRNRGNAVKSLVVREGSPTYDFGLTKIGQPKHPLYLAADAVTYAVV